MALVSHIGFASSRKLRSRLRERLRKNWISHAVLILEDETLGALVLHGEKSRHRVSTLKDFERENVLVGVVEPKLQLGTALTQVMGERRGNGRFAGSTELVCEVLRRGNYPGAFELLEGTSAQDLFAFLRRPAPVPREAVRLFNSSSGGTAGES